MKSITVANIQICIDGPSKLLDVSKEFDIYRRITKRENYHMMDTLRSVDFSQLGE